MSGYVYILASRKNGTLYTGVTGNLEQRIWEHREELDTRINLSDFSGS